jgi:hypothetical protein
MLLTKLTKPNTQVNISRYLPHLTREDFAAINHYNNTPAAGGAQQHRDLHTLTHTEAPERETERERDALRTHSAPTPTPETQLQQLQPRARVPDSTKEPQSSRGKTEQVSMRERESMSERESMRGGESMRERESMRETESIPNMKQEKTREIWQTADTRTQEAAEAVERGRYALGGEGVSAPPEGTSRGASNMWPPDSLAGIDIYTLLRKTLHGNGDTDRHLMRYLGYLLYCYKRTNTDACLQHSGPCAWSWCEAHTGAGRCRWRRYAGAPYGS